MGDALAFEFAFNDFMIVNPEDGGILDLLKFLVFNDEKCGAKFVETGGSPFPHSLTFQQRWVIVVSILARKFLKLVAKPMECCGIVVEFILNLLYLNGNLFGLICRILHGGIRNVEMPDWDSEKFISAIGHIDPRVDLFNSEDFKKGASHVEMGDRALMDLCMMCSKLAYENANVVTKVVEKHWKMHFVAFYNCWNEYDKEHSTQVFIMCDEAEDANLIVVSFRGTEPFDADDWITDFDYTWYYFHKLGKVHMGFLEALGLGTRDNTNSFQMHLQANPPHSRNRKDLIPPMGKTTAYYTVRRRVKELLKQHENAKFVVTGHSLGGALAILFPTVLLLHEEEEMMQRLLGIYTFGQPRVGNRKLARYVETGLDRLHIRYLRVVYCTDLVPRLPYDDKTFLYKHFGSCLYYNSLYIEKEVDEEPNRNYFGFAYLIPDHVIAVWELLRSLVMEYVYGPDYRESWESILLRLVGLAIPGVSAHSPLNYVNSIRLGRKSIFDRPTQA